MAPQALSWRGPLNFRHQALLAAPPEAVFELLAEPAGWPQWFAGMKKAFWTSDEVACIGARRDVVLDSIAFAEEFLAWDPGAHFAFTMLSSNRPLFSSLVEQMTLREVEGGTECVYAVSAEVVWPLRPFRGLLHRLTDKTFAAGLAGLQSFVASGGRYPAPAGSLPR